MKKFLLSFLFFFFYLSVYPSPYEEIRQTFKDQLYVGRARWIQDKNKYYECIEPFIKEAEKNLAIIQYCITNPDLEDIAVYFDCLLAYSRAFFDYYYVRPDALNAIWLKGSVERLMDAIKAFKEKGNIAHLNVKQEYNNTINLLQRANKAYYKALPIRVRITTCFAFYIFAFYSDTYRTY